MGDGHERSEPATPKRRERARREGDQPRSSMAQCALAIVFAALPAICARRFASSWIEAFAATATLASDAGPGRAQPLEALAATFLSASWSIVLVAWIGGVAAAIGSAALSGALGWSPAAIAVRFRKRGFGFGFRALANIDTLTQTGVAAAAAAAVFVTALPAASYVIDHVADSWRSTAAVAAESLSKLWWYSSAALCAIAIVDVALARRRHAQHLRMTPREVRDERAEQEGRPEIKARRRGIAMRRARRVRLEAIRRASAIIANPTHVAIALRYAPPTTDVPIVAAAGAGAAAAFVRTVAAYHDIPVIESPELARELFARVDVDEPVPEEYYAAIAAIFAWLLRTRGRLGGNPDR